MVRKKLLILGGAMLIATILVISGCGQKELPTIQEPKPVEIITVDHELTTRSLSYVGSIESGETLQLGFKTGGRVGAVLVTKDQRVEPGQPLIQLDTQDLTIGLQGAKSRLHGAEAQYAQGASGVREEVLKQAAQGVKRSEDSFQFAQEHHGRMKTLYESGAIAKHELEKVKLELDLREAELIQTQERLKELEQGAREEELQVLASQVEGARAEVERLEQLIWEGVLTAPAGGQVIELVPKVGEIVAAGQPLVVLAAGGQMVKTSVSGQDLEFIKVGLEVAVSSGEHLAIPGRITRVASSPDRYTRTYPVELVLAEDPFPLGKVVQVEILLGSEPAIWIPLGAVIAAAQDYVYVVDGERAVPRSVTIIGTRGSQVRVEGLASGEQVVVAGMRRLQPDDQVWVQSHLENGEEK